MFISKQIVFMENNCKYCSFGSSKLINKFFNGSMPKQCSANKLNYPRKTRIAHIIITPNIALTFIGLGAQSLKYASFPPSLPASDHSAITRASTPWSVTGQRMLADWQHVSVATAFFSLAAKSGFICNRN